MLIFYYQRQNCFKKLYHAFVESSLQSFQLKYINLCAIISNVKNHKYMLIHSKNIKPTNSIFGKNIFCISPNNDYIRNHGHLIVIIKNEYESSLKLVNNYLQIVSLSKKCSILKQKLLFLLQLLGLKITNLLVKPYNLIFFLYLIILTLIENFVKKL